ncbi:MAG: GNAT family N-acetyltransferase [Hoeflea sp.]|uniref:GNAT family N-acetyltransferase n=1 Tax=Hoeflea sp. TaxID=1940281 RepID=UPI001DA12926|nr:GNAT family N-acetyltransferase [Hoeflea sp.]MBU4529556.1 GNAT family N-acetyltransferase [Alphaproteobacteria bacterium]MBU4546675.1 GNAT family N-acetyltransferase [Alphaproteobacteria bacterium]MBU4550943.1 GNAT family N-acetyltransferase [Alphaproteobacteria bacterium]MBV1723885.1 GNAT family N-acetyltransferase [Hoeflea sp.]MBV1763162.1 GNAT family N-acetyltransferase [Hoeflea sp.]
MTAKPRDGFEVRRATRDDFSIAIGWAREEGWNPGLSDRDAFFAADPGGFLMGFADGNPVSSVSVVRYGDDQGFLGFYIVHPDARGKGYGMATWKAGMAYLENRTVGLDGVVAQQDNYRKSGFQLVGRNIRFSGVPGLPEADKSAVTGIDVRIDHADQLEKLDRMCFGAPRPDFLRAWVFAAPDAERKTFAAFENGDLSGFATIRRCAEGFKIGPLFAPNRPSAEALFRACCGHADAGATIMLDVPEANRQAVAMAESTGMTPVFETARMYRGAAPELPWSRIFGVTSFELG